MPSDVTCFPELSRMLPPDRRSGDCRRLGGHNFDGVDVVKASGKSTLESGGNMKRRQSGRLTLAVLAAMAIIVAVSAGWVASARGTTSAATAGASKAGGSGI